VGDRPPIAGKSRNQGGASQNGNAFGAIAQYVEWLCDEIRLTSSLGSPLTTIFFGGGTPSLLSVEQLNRILTTLDQQFGISSHAEISMEMDPGTFDLEQLQGYCLAGVNRVSLGVQAFQAELLQACGRSHTVDQIDVAIEHLHHVGLVNFSLDLISGLPHQTIEHWQESLERAIALAPAHLSCYDLTIEPVTAFGRRYKPGLSPLPSDDVTATMYRMASGLLADAGYEHYEISNYAKPGYPCRHNRVYWENRPFYGFGMGATSYIHAERIARPRKTGEYYAWVAEQQRIRETQPSQEHVPCPPRPTSDLLLDTLMLGLRLADGLSLPQLIQQFGTEIVQTVWSCLYPYYRHGWVEIVGATHWIPDVLLPDTMPVDGQVRLSDPEGFLFSNVVLVRLFETFGQ
jgi:oxygen-independent coproporphyrinogen-3 oxidase